MNDVLIINLEVLIREFLNLVDLLEVHMYIVAPHFSSSELINNTKKVSCYQQSEQLPYHLFEHFHCQPIELVFVRDARWGEQLAYL